jgi:hypothetical protein
MIVAQGQPGQKDLKTPFQQMAEHGEVHLSFHLCGEKHRKLMVQDGIGEKDKTLSQTNKQKNTKRVSGMSQVVECLPSKHETLI